MIRFTTPYYYCVQFLAKLREDHIGAYAAKTTLFMVISCFPFLMFLLSLLNRLPIQADSLQLLCNIFLPGSIARSVEASITDIADASSGAMLATTAIAFLWAGSKGFLSLDLGLNNVYAKSSYRVYVLRRLLSLLYTIVFAVFLLVVLIVFVFGNQLVSRITIFLPAITSFAFLVQSFRLVVGIAVLTLLFTLLFLLIPNRKEHRSSFFGELPGAIFAAVGWLGFSYLYSFYIDNMRNYSSVYGSLTAIVLCLLWLYICFYLLFIGAEINVILQDPASFHRYVRTHRHFR